MDGLRLIILTGVTMIAFAANSVFGRVALGSDSIDPAGYSLVRLASGAVMLALLILMRDHGRARTKGGVQALLASGSLASAAALFGYSAAFSFAYVSVDTGVGALILFACVQGTMIGWGLVKGERPATLEWAGLIIAFAAFVFLVSPGVSAPDASGAFLMALSGVAWGIYSLRGRGQPDPLGATAGNFLRSVPMALTMLIVFIARFDASWFGLLMAVLSGAITSALGYALWYRTLRELSAAQGAIVQLTVPAIATAGGIIFLGEPLSLRFILCSVLILGGVGVAILAKQQR